MGEEGETYVGAYGVCVRNDQVLLAHIPQTSVVDPGAWTLPGGGVAFGEHPDDAVLREVREEAGLTAVLRRMLGVLSQTYKRSAQRPRPPVHHLGLIYEVTVEAGVLVAEVDGTTDYCAWVPVAEVATMATTPFVVPALNLLTARDG